MGLIRTILIFIAVYYVSKFFMKYIAPVFLMKYVEKKANQQTRRQEQPVEKEGTTTIDKKPQQSQQIKDDVGEYVDYEEID
ncbi:hypothetical protein [Ochrovirga pacifica]|uniref:hypothetical protein n=1 Tax=Ochrovirga pacifica TaxID=1042376 RepID=UPI000255A4D6|nr:hypothetical protein [Ochrovirga pacifica]